MDRTRPLWEVYVIEGLESGRWALLTKYHHATIDGASGVMMLMMIHDLTPDAPPLAESPPWQGEPVPGDLQLLRLALGNLARNPAKAVRAQLRIARDLAESAGITSVSTAARQAGAAVKTIATTFGPGNGDRQRVSMPVTGAPPTPWNKSITAHRRFAMRSTYLSNIKRLKDATGGTVNDVVMAIVAGALREYLLMHDALPDRPLRAMVPVSIRTGDEDDAWTNRVSGLVADLPTDTPDPVERVERCRQAMDVAKRRFELVPADALADITQFASPVVATSAIRLASQLRLADRVQSPVNVVVSNVPGPRQPLYFSGAQLEQYIPVSTIAEGMGLNITVHSYLDELTFGLVSCRELVPDLWKMVDLHIDEIDRLFEATGADWAVPPRPAPPRRGPAKRRATSAATAAKSAAKPARKAARPANRATKSAKKATKSAKKASARPRRQPSERRSERPRRSPASRNLLT